MVEQAWLTSQRWFAGKARPLGALSAVASERLGDATITLLQVAYRDGGPDELYQLAGTPDTVDALSDGAIQASLYEAIRDERTAGPLHCDRYLDLEPAPPSRLLSAEQSNSSIAFGQRWILKLYRRIASGESRDLEVGRFLAQARFAHSPAIAGAISYFETTLAVLQEFASNSGDGWTYVLEQLQAPNAPDDVFWASHALTDHEVLLDSIERLGHITGELHAALASRTDVPDFAPEPAAGDDLDSWLADLRQQVQAAGSRAESWLRGGDRDLEARLAGAYEDLDPAGVLKIQIHGDYHLGQVLKTADGFKIIDFEGEPARPLAERRAKQPALRDVAGMLRSLHYAAYTAGNEAWASTAGDRFLAGWLEGSDGRFVASDEAATQRLLTLFQLAKAFYELNYELNNRPEWVAVPARGIERLLEQLA
ncbi:MAG: phosphotransferase [Chloroflexi bacterium]|nr:phosphotransferase [Chloroflexota bacterium]